MHRLLLRGAFLSLLAALVAAVLIVFVYAKNVRDKFNRCLRKFPGPKPNLVVGTAFEMGPTSKETLGAFLRLKNEHGPVYKLSMGLLRPTRFALLVADAKFLEFVLGSQKILSKTPNYRFLHRWLQFGLLTSTGQKWKQRRRIITPTFHFQILEQFVDVFNSAGEVLIEKLNTEANKETVNIYSFITLCALDIICESAMGTHVDAQRDSDSKYVRSVKEMCRIMMVRSFSVFKMFDGLYPLTADYLREKRALKILHGYTDSIIEKRRRSLLRKNQHQDHLDQDLEEEGFGKKKRLAFLDLLLQSTVDGHPLSHLDIREEVDTFVFEGHDTTASAMSFTLYCLANNPEAQARALEEQVSIFGDALNRPATYKDLQEMRYLEMAIKEALRLYPSVPFYGRELEEDMEYYDGTLLPAGLNLIIFAYGIHRDPEIWPEPEKFDPDRFLTENVSKRSPFAYIPFSAGPRNCIGQRFAMLEMKSTVSKVLRNFELHPANPVHKIVLASETVLKSANGVRIRINRRDFKKD